MRILMIGPFPPPIHGMSLANQILFNGLSKKHSVSILNTGGRRTKKIGNLTKQGKLSFRKAFSSLIQVMAGVCRILLTGKLEIVYITPGQSVSGYLKYTPFMWAARVRKIPYCIHIRGSHFRKMYNGINGWKKKAINKSLEALSGAIVLGPSLRNMFEGLLPEGKIFVCENGAEDYLFATTKEIEEKSEKYVNSNEIKVVYLSNLMESKGIIDLLEAVKNIHHKGKKIHLDIAGAIEPIIKEEVERYLKEYSNVFSYHGVVEGNRKRELLLNNNVFCLPSKHPLGEGQPNAILEAMSCGCIVLVTNLGAIKDVITSNFGLFVNQGDVKSIEAALEARYSSSMIFESWKEAKRKYTSSQSISRIENVIINLVKDK